MVALSKPLTMRQAAAELGLGDDPPAGRRLARLIRKREQETGKKILLGGGAGRRLLVTKASLRKHFDDLCDEGGFFNQVLKEQRDWVRDEVKVLEGRDKALAASIRAVRREVRDLTKAVQSLQNRD